MLNEIAECFAEFIVFHELKHVMQYRSGMIYEQYRKQKYEENSYEKEANVYALEEIKAKGKYFEWLLQFVPWQSNGTNWIFDENRDEMLLEYKKNKKN
ncbi:hypothetical protein [Lysinibacillus fusiformis]|uniref:hypothetical protein n=1 Tax=Lysinibacillus fusiformis TaxID=28031 RepID=UPI001642E958|nr:hypothetical protein [Lysinibacillus fusiformis]